MPDMTKQEPDDAPEPASATADEPEGKAKALSWAQPGSRGWFNYMRLSNLGLFLVPLLPLLFVVKAFVNPKVFASLPEGMEYGLTVDGELHREAGEHVSSVVVEMQGAGFFERLGLALPSLAFAVALAVVCRAMYRIEVNLASNDRKFTRRDQLVLGRALVALWVAWLLGAVYSFIVPGLIAEDHWNVHHVTTLENLDQSGTMAFTLLLVLSSFYTAYRNGKKAYDELSEVF